MANHGVYVSELGTAVSTPVAVETGIPFVIGLSPVHTADNPAAAGAPVLCTTFQEFVDKLGYSEDWATYPLCEFAYSQFKLYGMSPVIFCNLLDPATHKTAVAAATKDVVAKKVELTVKAINDSGLVVKDTASTPNTLVKDTDYTVYYNEDGKLTVELLATSAYYSEAQLSIAYNEVTPASITGTVVATGGYAYGSGIGTGRKGTGGDITIGENIVSVVATCGSGAGSAPIGRGDIYQICGNVSIAKGLSDVKSGNTRTILSGDLSNVSEDTTFGGGAVLTGTAPVSYTISIADGATVTLRDVEIDPPSVPL